MITCSLSLFLDMCLSPLVVQKVYTGKQVWGRHIVMTERNLLGEFTNYGR
jgi:hypothetical protein